ncbi:MAG: biotin-dependent carboxyltransferase family protein [Halothiobacillaceae bacterium]
MTHPVFRVLRPGFLVTLQNGGRQGSMHLGLAEGGALDQPALRWANRMLENPPEDTAIEITLGGLVLQVLDDADIALTGADANCRLDDRPLENWETHRVRAGQTLRFGHARDGLRSYLAVAGGLAGHAPTVPREGLGGLRNDGAPLARFDQLERASRPAPLPCRRLVPTPLRPADDRAGLPATLHFLPGGQWQALPDATRLALTDCAWTVRSDSDRMAARLSGPPLCSLPGIRSEPVAPGTIQLPPDGQPILLLADRQTLGGYAVAGWLTPTSLARLAQLRPGRSIRLLATDERTARAQWLAAR